VLQVPALWVSSIAEALQRPTWDLYLGRKHCAPTEFIYQGTFAEAEEAKGVAQALANTKQLVADYQVQDGEHEGEILTLMDVPVQFGEQKRYRDRRVTVIAAEST